MVEKRDSARYYRRPTADDIAEADRLLTEWGEELRAGKKFSVVSLPLDVPHTITSDALIARPHGLEIMTLFHLLVSDENEEAVAIMKAGMSRPRDESEIRKPITYVEAHLIDLAKRYLSVRGFLEKQFSIAVPSDSYDNLKARFTERFGDYLSVRQAEFGQPEQFSPLFQPNHSDVSNLADLPQLAATAVLECIKRISEIIEISIEQVVAPLTLDSAIQMARLHSFLEISYSMLNLENTKNRGWREHQANYRRVGASRLRDSIRQKLLIRLEADDASKYHYQSGKRIGQLKTEYLANLIQQDFRHESPRKRPPGKNTIREEIRKLNTRK